MREITAEITDDGRVVLNVPIEAWPVASLTVLNRENGKIVWHTLPESFVPVEPIHLNDVSLGRVRLAPMKVTLGTSAAPSTRTIEITYGEVPSHMTQRIPESDPPEALLPDTWYLLTIRQSWESDLKRYIFRVAPRG